jgi:2-aminoadipate transaminase
VIGVSTDANGIDIDALERVVRQERPRLLVVTPNFQNPTGSTQPLASRSAILRIARENSVTVVENDVYGELRYQGERLPTLKQLDPQANVILLRSFSKVAFPGLRVGWVVASREVTRRLSDAKQWCDLHTDQLSQAVLLRFAESGRLAEHRSRMVVSGRERLRAALEGSARFLPRDAEFTRPQGGMSMWVRLNAGFDTGDLLTRAQRENVTYLPGRYFAVNHEHRNALRLSFAGLAPEQITKGLSILGGLFASESVPGRDLDRTGLEPALV